MCVLTQYIQHLNLNVYPSKSYVHLTTLSFKNTESYFEFTKKAKDIKNVQEISNLKFQNRTFKLELSYLELFYTSKLF